MSPVVGLAPSQHDVVILPALSPKSRRAVREPHFFRCPIRRCASSKQRVEVFDSSVSQRTVTAEPLSLGRPRIELLKQSDRCFEVFQHKSDIDVAHVVRARFGAFQGLIASITPQVRE